ncbi:uncharacterized protein TM35_000241190 [Trypanosoma theileri]|uniref:Uncharacterized protein n=1 Tax=Trypanosoma theileri TaxID=67003 RepID=A0A1X0NS06_9TRYP|nr:uncharacterized protein TM35_000241190 [Trypanosoma theileri]ORC86969.1 hypothetical protein TM35_000241190 [Trypanosoma theileri]
MSLKVWVKRGGVSDDEALGIYVPVNGTAQSVVEACRRVFRHLQPSEVALRTEDGIIVAMASPVTALQSHTLEIVEMPQREVTGKHSGAPTLRVSSRIRREPVPQKQQLERKNVRVVPFGVTKKTQSSQKKEAVGALPQNHKYSSSAPEVRKEPVSVNESLALLWASIPSFTPESLNRSVPAVEKALQTAQYIYVTDSYKLLAEEHVPPNVSSSVNEEEDKQLNTLETPSPENNELPGNLDTHTNNESHDNVIHSSDITCGNFTGREIMMEEMHTVEKSDVPPSGEVLKTVVNTDEVSSFSNSSMLQGEANVSEVVPTVKEEPILMEEKGTSTTITTAETDCCDVVDESNINITDANVRAVEEKKELETGCEVIMDSSEQDATYFDEW